jgi:Family of unknown function (DUF5752)
MEKDKAKGRKHAPGPFKFCKAAMLIEATTLKAASLGQLLTGVTLAEDSAILYHLHRHFFVAPEVLPEYPNDFAYWVGEDLGNGVMAERLANLNLFRAATLAEVRREISILLAQYLASGGDGQCVAPAREFIFCQQRLIVMPCHAEAATPKEFLAALRTVDIHSVGYHLFQSRAMPSGGNDFTRWFEGWGYTDLARQIDRFDPYLNSLEDNRTYLVEIVEAWLGRREKGVSNA